MLVGAILVFSLLFAFSALLALAAFLSSAVFIGAGIFTTSIFIGWYNKSFSKGVKWLCILIFGFFGLGAGAFVCWLLSWIWPVYFTFLEILYWGTGNRSIIRRPLWLGGVQNDQSGIGLGKKETTCLRLIDYIHVPNQLSEVLLLENTKFYA